MTRPELSKKQIMLIMAGSMLTLFLAALDNTIVGTAMPKIIRDLHGMEHYSWPFTSYMLFSTVILPISGKLADIYGRKKITLLGISIFAISSILCGLSRNMIELSVLRGFQGIGGGICISSAFVIVSELFPMGKRAKYIGLITSMFALASIMGPGTGGIITDYLSWRWVFFINIPLSIAAFFLIFKNLPVIIHHEGKRQIDLAGVSFFILSMFPILFVITRIGSKSILSPDMIILFVFSIIAFAIFLYIEKHSKEPLLNLHYFRESIFSTSVIAASLGNMAIMGAAIYLPLYLQSTRGASATSSGIIMMPMMVAMIVASNLSGIVVAKFHKFKILAVIGLSVSFLGLLSFGLFGKYCPIWMLSVITGFSSFGIGMTFPIFSVAPQSVFPARQIGVVTSLLQFFRSLAASIGSAVFGTVMLSKMNQGLQNVQTGSLPHDITELVKNPAILSNPERLEIIRSSIPSASVSDFNSFIKSCLSAISGSIELIFIVSAVIIFIGLITIIVKFNEKKVTHAVAEYKRQH
jgi:EmrB/QacA subfamily drug resistance transporter